MKKLFKRKENGDIALISVFASIVILTILALIIDFGLIYYQSARLQNAVDSATVAVAHNLMADDASVKNTVETYMKENGVDITEKGYGAITPGTLTTKITYGDEDAIVLIDKKGLLTEEAENADDGRYITAGYLKVTVAVKCKGYWSAFSGLTGKQIVKSGYAKCDMQYNDMPEALKYTIFGNSPNTTDDYRKMTVRIDGRTNNTQAVVNVFTDIINGINESFVQPIIGAFGGEPNYNTLLNASLSHAIINGDVHSNSDISIGVNTIQASRAKDGDFNGKAEECICSIKCKENSVNRYCTVCQNDYRKCDGDEQTNDDYNQVIFTAVNKIDFSAGKYANDSFIGSIIGSDNDFETRVYVRNFQYVEQTQVVLYVLDQIDFDTITSTETLRSVFTQTATEYFENSITLPESQKNAILAQANNLEYISKNKYRLNAQKSIVYAASNAMANDVMLAVQSGNTLVNMLQPVLDSGGIDPTATPETLLKYDGTNLDIENSVITFTKPDSDQTAELYIVDSENTNRSVIDMTKQSLVTDSATAGYRFAIAKTFHQFANHIDAPNMKPYFIRAINRSVKNATTTKDSNSTATEYEDAKSVKDAVKKSQTRLVNTINSKNTMATINNGDGTFSKGSADATTDPSAVADGQSDTYIDNTYRTSASVTRQETSPLFRYRLNSTTNDKNKLVTNNDNGKSPYTLIKYGNNDAGHTTYNGVKVFNDEGNLSTAKEVVDDYAQKNNSKYGKNAVDKFEQTDVLVDADADDPSVHDYESHYGDDAVAKKKHYIENTLMLSEDSKFNDAAPKKDDVFLMSSGTKKSYLEKKITDIKNIAGAIGSTALAIPADLRVDPVASRYRTLIAATIDDLGYTLENSTGINYTGEASISKKYITPNGTTVEEAYSYEALLPGRDNTVTKTVDAILAETRNDFKKVEPSLDASLKPVEMNQANLLTLVNNKYNEYHQIKSTSGWTSRGSAGKDPKDSDFPREGKQMILHDKSVYDSIKNAWTTNWIGALSERLGVTIKSGRSVQINGEFKLDSDDSSTRVIIGDNSDISKPTYLYVKENVIVSRCNVTIGDNTTVIVDGHFKVTNGYNLTIGNNSKLIVNYEMFIDGNINVGENSIVVVNRTETGSNYSLKYGSLTTRPGSKMYIYKDVYKQNGGDNHLGGEFYTGGAMWREGAGGNTYFDSNSLTYLGRDLSTNGNGDLYLQENAIVVVNTPPEAGADYQTVKVTGGKTINMAAGSVLVTLGSVYHRVDASIYNMEPGSLIVTDMVKCGNSSNTSWLSNVIAKKIDTNTLVFKKGAHVFCSDEIYIANNKTIELNNSVKIVAGKNGDGESVSGNSSFTFSNDYNNATNKEFAIGCTGTIRNFGSGDFVLGANCFLSAQGLSIGSLTINEGGGFLIPHDSSTNTNITNLTVNDGDSTYIGNNLNVREEITVNADLNLYKVASAKLIKVNSGNLVVDSDCTATDVKINGEMNVANTLTCSGTIENQGKLLVGVAPNGSNSGNTGSFSGSSGTIENFGTVQIYGSASFGTLYNKYNTAKSKGSVFYAAYGNILNPATVSISTFNNDGNCKVICPDKLEIQTAKNYGFVEAGTLSSTSSTSSFTNYQSGQVKLRSATCEGGITNDGIIQCTGSFSVRGAVNNTKNIRLDNGCTITGKLTNSDSGNVQVTGNDANLKNVDNSGNISVYGQIISSGTFVNRSFTCSASQSKINRLENSGTFSTTLLNRNGSTESNIVNTGTLELYSTSGGASSNVTSIDNSGDFVSNRSVYTGNLVNTGKLEVFESLDSSNNITNSAKLYVHKSIKATSTINNNSNGSTGEGNSTIYAGMGNGSNNAIYAESINNGANIVVGRDDIYVTERFAVLESSMVCVIDGGIDTNDFELNNNCSLSYSDDLNIRRMLINKGNILLTEAKAKRIENHGNLYIESSGNFILDYLYNTETGSIAFDGGSLELSSQIESASIRNMGKLYVNGNVYCYGAFYGIGGEAYIYGDLDAANSVAFNNASIYLEEDAQLYVYGNVPTNAAGNGVYIKAKEETDVNLPNAVYSVYGKGDKINSGTINSDQPSSKLYFGGNVEVSTTNNTQTIKGQSFFYGKYTCASTMNFNIESEGLVYIADDVDAQGTDVYVKSSGLYCYGKSIKFKNIIGDAGRIYLINLPISIYTGVSGKIDLKNASMIYIPKGVTLPDGKLIMTDDCLNLSDPSVIVPITNDNFAKANSGFVTSGNVRIKDTLTIPEGSTLCVGGNLYLLGINARIVVKGNLYVTGKIYYSDSILSTSNSTEISELSNVKFDDKITMQGQNAEMFIGRTNSGTVNLRNQLNLYGNQKLYMENNLSTTGNLTNTQTSKGGIGGGSLVPNRGESVIIEGNSKAYISGDFFTNGPENNLGNAVYVAKDASLSCGGNLYNDSAIYNYGTLFVFGEMVNYKKADGTEADDARKYSSDSNTNYLGISLLNGNDGARTARFFVGGHLKDGTVSQKTIIFEGYAQNWGQININQPIYIKGHRMNGYLYMRVIGENTKAEFYTRGNSSPEGIRPNSPMSSIVAEQGSRANFGNNVAMLGGYITFNRDSTGNKDTMPVFSAEGDATFGQCILNGGIFYAKGAVGYTGEVGHTADANRLGEKDKYRNYYIRHLDILWGESEGRKGSYSIVNGYTLYDRSQSGGDCPQNKKALFYSGSGIKVGKNENSTGDDIGGSVQNWGDMYIDGSLIVYSNGSAAVNKIAVAAEPDSRTIIAGDCWSSGGTVTMRNTIFMCDGDFMAKRCARIGVSEFVKSEDDINSSSYTYVGGNMVTSTEGTSGKGDLGNGVDPKISTWNYLDIFSNANIYVGGSFFTNSIFHPFQNVTIVVDGKNKGKVNTSTNFITWLQTIANGVSLSISGYNKDDFKFIVNDRFDVQKTRSEGRTTSMFDRYYIHGSVYLNGRAKIADMTKFYVYGNFVNRTGLTAKLSSFEVGRALDVNNDGDTWASKGTFVDSKDKPRTIRDSSGNYILNPDYDYNYANATYVYVEDTLDVDRQMDIYPGTTIKIGKNYKLFGRVKLDHDTRLYCGGKIDSKRYIDVGQYADLFAKGGLSAWNYVVIREHAMLYSGGDVKCGTTYEGKTASTTYTEGSLKATLSNIKIRDESTAFVSGNMSALSYIELGKKDESYKDNLRKPEDPSTGNVCTCSSRCTGSGDEQHDGDCPVCSSDYSRCTGPLECICESECTSESYNADCPVCNANIAECKHVNPETQEGAQCTCKDTRCTAAKPDCPVCSTDYSKCEVASEETVLENDITRDLTDKADGGNFYIGKALVSYTSYIRQYGFSSTLVGKYVFANRYLTLRSNSDMWVLPEAFNNDTYKHVDKTFESDGTILGDIIKFIKETAFKVQDKLSLKNGSIYTMGDLSLNKNASIMGTHDCYVFGQATLLHDSLMYFGHDVKFYGPSFDLSGVFTGNFTGFTAAGDVYTTMKCNNKAKHPSGYTIYTKNYDPSKSYVCDKCGAALSKSTVRETVTCPVTVYANNDIVMATSVNMSLCYAVACNGDVTISDPYSSNTYDDRNLYQLPNAIASYNGNITYATMYGKIAALFYAPSGNSTPEKTVGNVKLDGFYQEVWGSIIGDTVTVDTFYINLHRFNNWRTMDLQIAESGNVYLISKEEYDKYVNNVDEAFMTSGNTEDETKGGAALFFDKDILNKGEVSGGGLEQTTN